NLYKHAFRPHSINLTNMRYFILLSIALIAVYAASDADKNAIWNKMLKTCEDVSTGNITREEAVKQVEGATNGFTLTDDDKKQMTTDTNLIKGIVDALGQMPQETRSSFKGLCNKSKLPVS
ncbi:hypothetical protein PENTCL1PPCAC_20587, partial [Pristionchus entomophagus]